MSEAELFVCGSIERGVNFPLRQSYYVSFEAVVGNQWRAVTGSIAGNSHVMENSHDGVAWSTPIDMHFAFQSVQGWPKLSIRVWSVDGFGRKDMQGYGVAFVPMPTGLTEVEIDIPTWKPTFYKTSALARTWLQLRQMVMGGNPVLRDDTLVHTNDSRHKIYTTSGGIVTIRLSVISRNAEGVGLKFEA